MTKIYAALLAFLGIQSSSCSKEDDNTYQDHKRYGQHQLNDTTVVDTLYHLMYGSPYTTFSIKKAVNEEAETPEKTEDANTSAEIESPEQGK